MKVRPSVKKICDKCKIIKILNNVYKDDNVIYYDINYAMIIDETKFDLEKIGSEINEFIYNTSIKYLLRN